jgi:putative spermidine/putrescine transport system permease protein
VGEAMRGRFSISSAVWLLLGAVYFIVPLVATLLFSLKTGRNYSYNLSAWTQVIHDHEFWKTVKLSGLLALETIVISLGLLVPTAYWAHLKLPKVRTYIEFVTILPFVVPPIILVVGLLQLFNNDLHAPFWYLGHPYTFLVSAYVVLAFPYVYRSLDAGFRAIDVHTLTEAAQSLGASWQTTFLRVILPNVRQAALSAAFLTLAIVMGEFTIASLSLFNTFPVYINQVNQEQPYEAASLSLLSFVITWAAMAGLLLVGRPPRSGRRRFLFLRAKPVH